MFLNALGGRFARFFSSIDSFFKPLPFYVSQVRIKLSCRPVFHSVPSFHGLFVPVIPRPRPWNLFSGAAEACCCCCSAGSKVRKRSGTGGLTSQLLLLVPLRGPNVGGQCSSCRFASPPPARAPAHFRFRTRARTAAATVFLRSCGPGQRGFPPVVGVGRPPFLCHSGRSPLSFRAFLPLSFRA